MASNESHIHWTGPGDEEFEYLGQQLQVMTELSTSDPIGALHIHAAGFVGTPLYLPNSSISDPKWDSIPGTSPVLEVRQDGHYPVGYIRIRQA